MPKFLVVYTNGETSNSCTFEHSENVSPFVSMLRDLGYQYEVYFHYEANGYVRTNKYPAA